MPDLYTIDVNVIATVYVKADSPEEAKRLAQEAVMDSGLEVAEQSHGDIAIFGGYFDDEHMPDVSLSPAMTLGALIGEPDFRAAEDELFIAEDEDEEVET